MPPVNLKGPDGRVVSVDESEVDAYHTLGYTPETLEQEAGRAIESELESAYGDSTLTAGALGVARGATLGLSDVALRGAGVSSELLSETQSRNAVASTVGEVVGAVAPALLTGGTGAAARGLAYTPAGQVARLERVVTGLGAGAEAGLATKVGAAAAGGAAEGALAGAGAYISDVALEKRELSAEAFVGAMGKGALFGGVIGGGVAGAERGMVAARKLFPTNEVTEEAVTVAEQTFRQATNDSFAATDEAVLTARQQLDQVRLREREQRLAARSAIDEQKVAQEQARTAQQQAKVDAEKAKAEAIAAQGRAKAAQAEAKAAAEKAKAKTTQEQQKVAQAKAKVEAEKAKAALIAAKEATARAKAADAAVQAAPSTKPRVRQRPEKATLPEGFDHGPLDPRKTKVNKGVPALEDVDPEAVYVIKASDIADRVVDPLQGSGRQAARTESIEKGWSEGKKFSPLRGTLRKDGSIEWSDGRHRFDAALKGDRDIAVRLDRSVLDEADEIAPVVDDVADVLDDAAVQASPETSKLAEAVREVERTKAALPDWVSQGQKRRAERLAAGKEQPGLRRSKGMDAGFSDTSIADEILNEPISLRTRPLNAEDLQKRQLRLEERQLEESLMADRVRPGALKWGDAAHAFDGRGAGRMVSPAAETADAILDAAAPAGRQADITAASVRAKVGDLPETDRAARASDTVRVADDADEILAMADEQAAGRFVDDAQGALKAIGDYERAQVQLVEALGPAAPPKAQEIAAAYAQKIDEQSEKVAERMATQADDAVKRAYETISLPGGAGPAGERSGLRAAGEKAGQGLAALEVLQAMGIGGVPDVDKLPVVGPLLSVYAKYMAARGIYRRFGGKVPASAEAKIAEKAAGMRDRASKAVDRLLDVGARVAAKGGGAFTAGAVAALESPLFDSDEPKRTRRAPAKPAGKPIENFRARADELARVASNPDGARNAIRRRVQTTDPSIGKAVEDAAMRKLEFLAGKVPKDPLPPNPLRKREWTPDRVELERFARYVKAAEDPLTVLEDLERGAVTPEAAETVKAVYPQLFGEIQSRLIDRIYELQAELPYQRRVQISLLFDVAVDDSMKPDAIMFYQGGYEAAQDAPDALQPGAPPQPPVPALAANVSLSEAHQTGMDRRAVR